MSAGLAGGVSINSIATTVQALVIASEITTDSAAVLIEAVARSDHRRRHRQLGIGPGRWCARRRGGGGRRRRPQRHRQRPHRLGDRLHHRRRRQRHRAGRRRRRHLRPRPQPVRRPRGGVRGPRHRGVGLAVDQQHRRQRRRQHRRQRRHHRQRRQRAGRGPQHLEDRVHRRWRGPGGVGGRRRRVGRLRRLGRLQHHQHRHPGGRRQLRHHLRRHPEGAGLPDRGDPRHGHRRRPRPRQGLHLRSHLARRRPDVQQHRRHDRGQGPGHRDVAARGTVDVIATDSARILALAVGGAFSLTAGAIGIAISVGVTIAKNTITGSVRAIVETGARLVSLTGKNFTKQEIFLYILTAFHGEIFLESEMLPGYIFKRSHQN